MILTSRISADEEKKRRSPQGNVSFLSMSVPKLADEDRPITSPTDTTDNPPFNNNPGPTTPLIPSPMSNPHGLCPPAPLPLGTGTTDHSPIGTNAADVSEVPPAPSPPPDNLDPPSHSPPPIHPPYEAPIPPHSDNVQTPRTTLTQLPLPSAGDSPFDLTGVLGDFISESIRAYWESVPGGVKWVEMVKSYLELQTLPPSKGVRALPVLFFHSKLTNTSSNFSDFQQLPGRRSCKPG